MADTEPSKTIAFVDGNGEIWDIPESNADKAIERGFTLASDDDIKGAEMRAKFGDAPIRTFVEGAASGATFGLSDIAQAAVLDNQAEIEARRELNPTARMAGEITGMAGLTIATAGIGGEAALAAKGASALQKAGTVAKAAAIRGGVEGVLYGAGNQSRDDYLADKDVSAERIILGGAIGGLTGLAAGGVVAGGASLIGSGASKAMGKLLNRTEKQAAATQALEAAVVEGEANAAARASADVETLTSIGLRSDEQHMAELAVTIEPPANVIESAQRAAQANKLAVEFDDLVGGKVDRIRKGLEHVNESLGLFEREVNVGAKPDVVRKMFDIVEPEITEAHALHILDMGKQVRGALDDMLSDPHLWQPSQRKALTTARAQMAQFEERWADLPTHAQIPGQLGIDDKVALFIDLDKTKRTFGQLQQMAGRGSERLLPGERVLQAQYAKPQALLEDATIWGEPAAKFQRVTNAAQSEMILRDKPFRSRFNLSAGLEDERSLGNAFDKQDKTNLGAIKSLLSNAGEETQFYDEQAFALGLGRRQDWMEVAAQFYDVSPALRKRVETNRELLKQVFADVREVSAARQIMKSDARAAQALNALPIPDNWRGAAASVRMNIARTVNTVADVAGAARATSSADAAARVAARGEKAVSDAASGIVRRTLDGALGLARKTGPGVQKAAARAADMAAILGAQHASRGAVAEQMAVRLAELRDPNNDKRRAIRTGLYELQQTHPDLAASLDAQVQRAADFVASKIPPAAAPVPGDMFGHLKGRAPLRDDSKSAMAMRYFEALSDPGGALRRMADGDVRREDVEVLSTMFPREMQRLRAEVMAQLSDAKNPPSYKARIALSRMLGIPADPSLAPENVAYLQQMARNAAAANEQAQTRKAPTKLAGQFETRTDQLIGKR